MLTAAESQTHATQILPSPTEALGAAVLDALADASEIIIIAGYASASGWKVVAPHVEACLKRKGRVVLLIGIDRGGVAGPEIIHELGKLVKSKVGSQFDVRAVVERPDVFLHSKVYFGGSARGDQLVIGSVNLTKKGLSQNIELALRETGNLNHHRAALLDFINSVPRQQTLTSSNVDHVEQLLKLRPGPPPRDPVEAAKLRGVQAAHLQKLLDALGAKAGKLELPDRESVLDLVAALRSEGSFFSHEFDLEKLSVPVALARFRNAGILSKAIIEKAFSADLKTAPVTASFSLVPPQYRTQYRKIAMRLGRALNRFGFETPYGVWVPQPYVERLQIKFEEAASDLPAAIKVVNAVKRHVKSHRDVLKKSISTIVKRAQKDGGLIHPKKWAASPHGDLGKLKERVDAGGAFGAVEKKRALELIRIELVTDAERQLSSEFAAAKVRRLRPKLVQIEVGEFRDVDSSSTFLASLAWQVAEHALRSAKRQVRLAVVDLSGAGRVQAPKQLVRLSELLSDGDERERAMGVFFEVFGRSPHSWTAGAGGPAEGGDEEGFEAGDE